MSRSPERMVFVNAAWSFVGLALPMVAALAAVPWLLKSMGAERLGLLTIVWVLVGYFSFFDLGIGRALTKLVAQHDHDEASLDPLIGTGVAAALLLGCLGALGLALLAPWLMAWPAQAPPELQAEVRRSLWWVVLGTPVVVVTAALRGLMEGFQQFRQLTVIRVPSGVAMFIAPCLTSLVSPRLDWAVAATVLVRALTMVAHWVQCRAWVHLTREQVQRVWLKRLLSFGGWITVSGVVGPIIVSVDRFVLSAKVAIDLIVSYTAPFEVVSRLLVIPTSLAAALMPALSHLEAHDKIGARRTGLTTLLVTAAITVPLAALAAGLAPFWLSWWLGPEVAKPSIELTRWLLLGFACNALGHVPFVALLSRHQAKAVACLHVIELPLYLVALWWATDQHGLLGAAVVWALRAAADAGVLTWMWLRDEDRNVQAQ